MISVVQGNTDTSFQFNLWPWADTIGYQESGTYGIDRCGTKSYQVSDSNNNIVDWVTVMPDGTLKVQPGLTTPTGIQDLTLTVIMDDYVDSETGQPISASTSFSVNVDLCTATISTQSSSINDLYYHRWGDATPSTRSFFPFTYVAGCALNFEYTAKIT